MSYIGGNRKPSRPSGPPAFRLFDHPPNRQWSVPRARNAGTRLANRVHLADLPALGDVTAKRGRDPRGHRGQASTRALQIKPPGTHRVRSGSSAW